MADTKISALVDGSPAVTTDYLPVSRTAGITTRKVTAQSIAALAVGLYAVRGLLGAPNTATPLTKYDYSADVVQLWNATTTAVAVRTSTGTLTNDTALAGSTPNGRDQAAVFTVSTWLHFYFIWNGTTLATLSSMTAPPTGPTLPAGYTQWAYAGAIFYGAASTLIAVYWAGSRAMYQSGSTDTTVLNAGSALVATQITITNYVPPNAVAFDTRQTAVVTSGTLGRLYNALTQVNSNLSIAMHGLHAMPEVAGQNMNVGTHNLSCPNVNRQLFYLVTFAEYALTMSIGGYTMPNGDV